MSLCIPLTVVAAAAAAAVVIAAAAILKVKGLIFPLFILFVKRFINLFKGKAKEKSSFHPLNGYDSWRWATLKPEGSRAN